MNPLLWGLVGLGLLRGANSEVHRFERLAAIDLGSRLSGDDKQVSVRADVGPEVLFGNVERVTVAASKFTTDRLPFLTEPEHSKRGVLRNFTVDLSDFVLAHLHFQRLKVEIPDSRFDIAAAAAHHVFRITRSGTGTSEVEISQDDLADFVRYKYPTLHGLTLRIDRDKVFVEGQTSFLSLSIQFFVVGTLETTDGIHLNLTHSRILIGGKPADAGMTQTVLKSLNPVVDLNRDLHLDDAVHVERLVLRNGLMRAEGTTFIPSKKP